MGAAFSKTLLLGLGTDMGIQVAAWVVAASLQTEKFYDFTGSTTYWITILLSLRQRMNAGGLSIRQMVNALLVLLWSGRLGSFLLYRVIKDGGDSRFNKVKKMPGLFLVYWLIQGIWCFLTPWPVFTLLAKEDKEPPTTRDYVAWGFWALGFILQVLADNQKTAFRSNSLNKGKFINTGVWSLSQHPNYAGEIIMWFSMFLSCSTSFAREEYITALSPAFVYFLLTRVSGIPLLDKAARKKWGDNPDYLKYITSTPILFPFIGQTSTRKAAKM